MSEFVEQNCTIEHEGQQFESGGAYRTENSALVYVTDNRATDWHGNTLGRVFHVSTYPNNLTGTKTDAIRVRMIDGSYWHGRYGSDWSQACRLRRCK